MSKQIKVKLIKSSIGYSRKQKEILRGIGIKKLHHTKVLSDTPSIRGIINKVSHLLEVEEIID